MESPKEQAQIAGRLTFTETQRLEQMITQMRTIIEHPEITEERFNDITNVQSEITAVREIYLNRLMAVFKRGYVIQ